MQAERSYSGYFHHHPHLSKQPPVERVALFIPPSGKNKEETACLQSLGFEPHAKHGVCIKTNQLAEALH